MAIIADSQEDAVAFLQHTAANGQPVYSPGADNGVDMPGVRDDDIQSLYDTWKLLGKPGVSSGGGGGGGPSQEDRLASTMELAQALNTMGWEDQLKYYPQMSDLAFQLQQDQLPKQQELNYNLLQQYLPGYSDLMRAQQSKERTQDINDVQSLMPTMSSINAKAKTTGQSARYGELRNSMYDQVLSDLEGSGQLSASDIRNIEQGVRGGQVARGLEGGDTGAAQEATARAMQASGVMDQRKQQAMANAGNLNAQEQSYQAMMAFDPFSTALGRPSSATNTGVDLFNNDMKASDTTGEVPQGTNAAVNISGLQGNYGSPLGQDSVNQLLSKFYGTAA